MRQQLTHGPRTLLAGLFVVFAFEALGQEAVPDAPVAEPGVSPSDEPSSKALLAVARACLARVETTADFGPGGGAEAYLACIREVDRQCRTLLSGRDWECWDAETDAWAQLVSEGIEQLVREVERREGPEAGQVARDAHSRWEAGKYGDCHLLGVVGPQFDEERTSFLCPRDAEAQRAFFYRHALAMLRTPEDR